MKAVVSYITFDGTVVGPFGLWRLRRSRRTDTSTFKQMLSIYRVSQFLNTEFMTDDYCQSFIIAQMRETFNKMYSCLRKKSETISYVRMTSDSVIIYDETDANGPPCIVVAKKEPTERKPNQMKRSKDAQFCQKPVPWNTSYQKSLEG